MSDTPSSSQARRDATALIDDAETIADGLFDGSVDASDAGRLDAQQADRLELLPRDRFAPLASAGLFGISGPTSAGGSDLGPGDTRRVLAAIGGGCGSTFFAWVQHLGVVRTVVGAAADDDAVVPLLRDLCAGRIMAGVAFAHLRRHDRRAITATRAAPGWRFDGVAPWATSWGIADVFAIAAESDDGQVVWGLVPGEATATMRTTPLSLPVFSSTGTVALTFDDHVVDDHRVIGLDDAEGWRHGDRRRAALGQPAVLGVAERAIRLLDDGPRSDAAARTAAGRLAERLDATWRRDDELLREISDDAGEPVIEAAAAHRARCLQLATDATTALLAASGGGGMDLGHPAQRLAREATFYVIQAQTDDGRRAVLESVTTRPDT